MTSRLEPDIIDDRHPHIASDNPNAELARIADALNEPNEYGEVGSAALAGAILRGLQGR